MPEWEFVKINYAQEGSTSKPGTMIWSAAIKWPHADRLDIREEVRIEDVLNELNRQGWELVSQEPALGINSTDYTLKRRRK